MISSTKPSSPTNACRRLAASTNVSSLAAHCSRNSSGSRGMSLCSVFIDDYGFKTPSTKRSSGLLLNFHPENFQNSLQLLVAKKPNFKQTFSLPVAKLHFGAEAFAKTVLHVPDMRIKRPGCGGFGIVRSWSSLLVLEAGDEFLGLPHA